MYHTPQGVVYAASPAGTVNTLPEGFFFNYQTAAAAATHLHQTAHGKYRINLPSSFKCFFGAKRGVTTLAQNRQTHLSLMVVQVRA